MSLQKLPLFLTVSLVVCSTPELLSQTTQSETSTTTATAQLGSKESKKTREPILGVLEQVENPSTEIDDSVLITDEVELVRDVIYGTAIGGAGNKYRLLMDVAYRKDRGTAPVPAVIYVHGGGWIAGSKEVGLRYTTAFARGGYFAASINYRLAQDGRYPAAIQDCKTAVQFLRANAEQLGIDPEKIGIWGHSTGGNLAALVAVTGNSDVFSGAYPDVSSVVQCAVLVSAPYELKELGRGPNKGWLMSWFGKEVDEMEDLYEQGSPMNHVDEGDPPILVAHARHDQFVPYSQAWEFRQKLQEANVDSEIFVDDEGTHSITADRLTIKIADFFDQRLGGSCLRPLIDSDQHRLDVLGAGQQRIIEKLQLQSDGANVDDDSN